MATNGAAPARGRIAEFFGSVPLVTLIVLLSCVIIYVVEVAGDFWSALALFSLSPATVFGDLQLYRIVTAAFTHASVLHVGMNMLSFVALGSSLEALLGSIAFAFLLSAYVAVVGTVFLLLGTFASVFDSRYWYQAAVGFSGVIFALAVDECALSPAPTRSIFGFFSVRGARALATGFSLDRRPLSRVRRHAPTPTRTPHRTRDILGRSRRGFTRGRSS